MWERLQESALVGFAGLVAFFAVLAIVPVEATAAALVLIARVRLACVPGRSGLLDSFDSGDPLLF